jgi:peptide/nickel transport system ATP-binding protein
MTASISTKLLQVKNLCLELETARGRVRALEDMSFSLEKGKTLGLIGESGCGKSLTAMSIIGLLPENAHATGSIIFEGQELCNLRDSAYAKLRGARIAMVFQEPMTALNPVQTIGEQIAEPLRLHQGLARTTAKFRALELLDRVQLPRSRERLEAYPHELSGGQRQRVMIAMALSCRPVLLIADEPTTALDASTQKEVLALMHTLVREDKMSLLLISHDLGLMHDHVDEVAVMYAGSIVEQAATQALFSRRVHPYTQGLFAARPKLGLARGSRLATIPGSVPELHAMPLGCAFAPRCGQVVPQCLRERPPLRQLAVERSARCVVND